MSIVTISRFTMSGGTRLADRLSQRLGIPSISREVITQVANRFDLSEELVWEKLERAKGQSPERNLYLAALQLALAERAQQGPFVYHGLAGHFLLKGIPRILKVGIVAPLEMRAETLMKQKGISLDEAKKSIQRWDEKRSKWVRFLYNVEWLDPSLYDLVVNVASIGEESACELIACELNREEFRELPGQHQLIDDFVLASKVKVLLAVNDRTKGLELEVKAEEQGIRITGRVPTGSLFYRGGKKTTRNDIIRIAKTEPEVRKVTVDLEGSAVPVD